MRIVTIVFAQSMLVSLSAVVCGDDPPRGNRPVLRSGDRFVVSLRYWNVWQAGELRVENTARPGARLSPAELGELRRNPGAAGTVLRPAVRNIPRADDPLFVDMELTCSVAASDRLRVQPKVSRVRYFDDRGRDWTLLPSKEADRKRAATIVARTAARWAPDLDDAFEREMLEEQLLGAALALLHAAEIETLPDRVDPSEKFPDLAALLDERLPESYPAALRPLVLAFLDDALARTVTPVAADASKLRRGATTETRGVTYEIVEITSRRDGYRVRATGTTAQDEDGRHLRESLLFDAATGVVIESTCAVTQNQLEGTASRFGCERWQTTLKSFERAARGD